MHFSNHERVLRAVPPFVCLSCGWEHQRSPAEANLILTSHMFIPPPTLFSKEKYIDVPFQVDYIMPFPWPWLSVALSSEIHFHTATVSLEVCRVLYLHLDWWISYSWEMSGSYKHLCFFLSVMLSSHSVFTKRNLLAYKSAWAALFFNSLLSELLCWCCRMVRRQAVNHHMHLAVFVWSLFSQPLSLATYKDNECKMVLCLLLKLDAQLKEKVDNFMLCSN